VLEQREHEVETQAYLMLSTRSLVGIVALILFDMASLMLEKNRVFVVGGPHSHLILTCKNLFGGEMQVILI
jgi:hypothetical protein